MSQPLGRKMFRELVSIGYTPPKTRNRSEVDALERDVEGKRRKNDVVCAKVEEVARGSVVEEKEQCSLCSNWENSTRIISADHFKFDNPIKVCTSCRRQTFNLGLHWIFFILNFIHNINKPSSISGHGFGKRSFKIGKKIAQIVQYC